MKKEKHKQIKFLESKRIYLRPVEIEDTDMIFTTLWDSEARRLTGTQTVFSRQGVKKWLESAGTDSSRLDLLICLQDNASPYRYRNDGDRPL